MRATKVKENEAKADHEKIVENIHEIELEISSAQAMLEKMNKKKEKENSTKR